MPCSARAGALSAEAQASFTTAREKAWSTISTARVVLLACRRPCRIRPVHKAQLPLPGSPDLTLFPRLTIPVQRSFSHHRRPVSRLLIRPSKLLLQVWTKTSKHHIRTPLTCPLAVYCRVTFNLRSPTLGVCHGVC